MLDDPDLARMVESLENFMQELDKPDDLSDTQDDGFDDTDETTMVQKRLRRERRMRKRVQDQLDAEVKRRIQMEDALKAAGAAEQIRMINETLAQSEHKTTSQPKVSTSSCSTNQSTPSTVDREQHLPIERTADRDTRDISRDRLESPPALTTPCSAPSQYSGGSSSSGHQTTVREQQPPPPPLPPVAETKPWAVGYSGIDLMNTGAAFWQNYSESLAQELEMERKSRQQHVEREVKSPLQDRSGYYKNSVLFTSTAT